ncbi:S8 family serine peptidase [Haloferula sp.]|uniref:S8 family serine peptidase n=1 Tax=Haloferula sp. TaxID=2497595 RepID=UPI00329A9D8A
MLVSTGFKYPNLVIHERVVHDSENQDENLTTREVMVADRLLIRIAEGAPIEEVRAALKQEGQELLAQLGSGRVWSVGLPHAAMDGLSHHIAALSQHTELLELITPDYLHFSQVLPDDFQASKQWGLQDYNYHYDIDSDNGWDIRNSAAGVVVGVVDTGVRLTHEDIVGNLWTNSGEIPGNGVDDDSNGYVDDVHGIDTYNDDSDPSDDGYHGTHVAGIIGAQGNNSIGITGVAWDVQIMAVKFLDSNGVGSDSDALEAIDYAVANGASILNSSWGSDSYSQLFKDKILEHEPAGILFVAAAGNESRDIEITPKYPASYDADNVVSVGAYRYTGARRYNYGEESVDILAPGYDIYSLSSTNDISYNYKSGTSMATGFATGTLALLKAEFPAESYSELRDRLFNSSVYDPQFLDQAKTDGQVHLYRALTGTYRDPVVIETHPVTPVAYSGSGLELEVSASGGEPFEYQWYHNGSALIGEESSSLVLDGLAPSDNGSYHVVVTNLTGSETSDSATVTVTDVPPVMVTDLNDRKVFPGQSCTLEAGFDGSRPFSYQWYFNGSPLSTTPTHHFSDIGNADQGAYQLAVTNAFGTTFTSSMDLKVACHHLQQWEQVHPNPPTNGVYTTIQHVNGFFITVGRDGVVAVSDDAEQWLAPDRVTEEDLARVAFGSGKYVAVGNAGTIIHSDDGLNWSSVPSGVTESITDVAYGDGIFVAVAGHHVLVSADGQNWTPHFVSDKNLGKIAFGAGMFGIIADNQDSTFYTFRSSNGISWTEGTPLANTQNSIGDSYIEYRDNKFWMFEGGDLYDSSDLISWENKTWYGLLTDKVIPVGDKIYKFTEFDILLFDPAVGFDQVVFDHYPTYAINHMTYAEGKLVAVGWYGKIFRSLDGTSMEQVGRQMPENISRITFGHAGYLLTSGGGKIYRSTDGRTIDLATDLGSIGIRGSAYGNGVYMIKLDDSQVMISTDLENWQAYPTGSVVSSSTGYLTFTGGKFWVLYGDALVCSSDGINWEEKIRFYGMEGLVSGNGVHLSKSSSSYDLRVSNDALVWNEVELPEHDGRPSSMLWADGLFRVLTKKSDLLTSPDGVTWTAHDTTNLSTDPTGVVEQYYYTFVYHDGVYVVSNDYGFYLSYNCIDWVEVDSAPLGGFTSGDDGMLAQNAGYEGIMYSQERAELFAGSTIGGGVDVRRSPLSFHSNRNVFVSITPHPGYVFTGWTGDLTSSETELSPDLDSSLNIQANFKPFNLAWRQEHFSPAEIAAGLSEGHLDSDGDGYSNYYEYLFGMNPRSGTSAGYPLGTIYSESPDRYMALEFDRRGADSSIQYHLESSIDLVEWYPTPSVLIEKSDHGDGTERVRLRDAQAIGNTTKTLYRISVEELNP